MGSTEESLKKKLGNKTEDNGKQPQDTEKDKKNLNPKSTAIPVTPNSGGRPRHDSSSSIDSSGSPSNERMKRRRTTSLSTSPLSSFFFPSKSHSSSLPPSPLLQSSLSSNTFSTSSANVNHMSLDEVINAVNGVTNMALAHEIALDSEFKLQKFEPPKASLEKQVRDVMHKAFWDNLREQLQEEPPVYTQAFILLQEIRDQLMEITLPHQKKLRQDISEKLDFDLIKQQAEHDVLNFEEYSGYVVSMMAKLCAPIRDDAIKKLQEESDVVSVFSGVAETLDLMKLDMANYTIQMIRPTIMKQIVEYEKEKFKQFIETQNDGLELTREWIISHIDDNLQQLIDEKASSSSSSPQTVTDKSSAVSLLLKDPLTMRSFCSKVLNDSLLELLQWPMKKLLPETVCVDSERVLEQRDRLYQVCLLASIQLVALSTLASNCPSLNCDQEQLKQQLKKDVCPILDPAYTQSETISALPNLTEQVIVSLQTFLKDHQKSPLDSPVIVALRSQLSDLQSSDHRISTLLTTRLMSFFKQIISKPGHRVSLPSSFLILQEEVARIWSGFLRVSQHNRAVFGEYYFDIIEEKLKQMNAPTKSEDTVRKEKDIRWDDLDLD